MTESDPLIVEVMRQLKIDVIPRVSLRDSAFIVEPLLWIALFAEHNVSRQDMEERFGVPGPFALAFASALRRRFPLATAQEQENVASLMDNVFYGVQWLHT